MMPSTTPNSTNLDADTPVLSSLRTSVSARSAAAGQWRTGLEPIYPLSPLLALTGLTPEGFADKLSISRASAYRRKKDGVKWSEADEWAVVFGYLPYEVWPEWALADPADWCDIPPDPEQTDAREPHSTSCAAA
jgi:hypothetical protein